MNLTHDQNTPMSKHATMRCQQRGVRKDLVQTVLDLHDVDLPARGNCRILRISRDQLRSGKDGFTPQQSKQLEKLCIVWSDSTNSIVTVMHDFGSNRHYRRAA